MKRMRVNLSLLSLLLLSVVLSGCLAVGPQPVKLTGTVSSLKGEPVAGALVTMDGKEATTNAKGGFTLDGVRTGNRDLNVVIDDEVVHEESFRIGRKHGALKIMVLGKAFEVVHDPVGRSSTEGEYADWLAGTLLSGEGATPINLTTGSGLTVSALMNGFAAINWNTANNNREDAIAEDKYFQFGFEVDPGYTATLATVEMSLRRSALNGPMNYELQVSLDDFATPGLVVSNFTYRGRTSGTAPSPDPRINDPYYHMENDLPGHANSATSPGDPIRPIELLEFEELHEIPGGTTVTFRLYAWGNESTTNTNSVALGRMVGPKIKAYSLEVAPE